MSTVVIPPTSTSYTEQRNIEERSNVTPISIELPVGESEPKPKVLAIIPCRSGSKGLPGKNIKQLNGVPLMGYAIKPALECNLVDRVIVDTDDEGYAAIAQKLGADVPFFRPKHLAEDVPTEDVIIHALDWLQEHEDKHYDIVVTLQCTTPGIKSSEITQLIEYLDWPSRTGYASSATVCEVSERPEWMYLKTDNQELRHIANPLNVIRGEEGVRQNLREVYRLTGAGYATRISEMMKWRSLLAPPTAGVTMPRERSIDIDNLFDFQLAEKMISEWQ